MKNMKCVSGGVNTNDLNSLMLTANSKIINELKEYTLSNGILTEAEFNALSTVIIGRYKTVGELNSAMRNPIILKNLLTSAGIKNLSEEKINAFLRLNHVL